MSGEWPADAESIAAARRFIDTAAGHVVVASHNDADGLSAAVITMRALTRRGVTVRPLPAPRGEHVHRDAMRERIASVAPDALVVLDMGTRPAPIIEGLPTLVIDHHDASGGIPPGVVMVNGYDREPVAPSSVLAYEVCRHVPGLDGSTWLAAFGAVADLGTAGPFTSLIGLQPRGSAWTKAVALVNAARRAAEDDVATALRVLESATGVHDIVDGRVAGVDLLRAYSAAVQAEVARCSRVPPRHYGDAALIRFSSGAQVHPIVATRWSRRLAPAVVIAANEGFIPGRVNFAVRSHTGINLLEWLRSVPFRPSPSAEYANGHPRATGGSLELDDFDRFVEALGAPARPRRHETR